jgi:hypothetical protein
MEKHMKVLLTKISDGVQITVFANEVDLLEAAQNLDSRIYDESQLPDREFINAWTIDATIDLERAKEVWRNKMRPVRDARLKQLDLEWMRAMEQQDYQAAAKVVVKKVELRDITKRDELKYAKTLDQVKAFWPEVLNG